MEMLFLRSRRSADLSRVLIINARRIEIVNDALANCSTSSSNQTDQNRIYRIMK